MISTVIAVVIALVVSLLPAATGGTPAVTEVHSSPLVGSAHWALSLLGGLSTYEGLPDERYDRDTYDIGWLDLDHDCQSVRHEVLIAENVGAVQLDERGCKVLAGRWIDPYDRSVILQATDTSIDHVVSLADAHRSGGWRWSHDLRSAFANDLDDPASLAVSLPSVNSAKGSASPDTWLPADPEAQCSFGVAWVRVKTRWGLAVTVDERSALEKVLGDCLQARLPANVESTPLEIINFDSSPLAEDAGWAPNNLVDSTCDARYESVCIPGVSRDLDCGDIAVRGFQVTADPHHFDGNQNGVGCE